MYEALYLQFFQGDQIRGIGGIDDPAQGRRVIAQIMHDAEGANPPSTGPAGSVRLGTDGSMGRPGTSPPRHELADAGAGPRARGARALLDYLPTR